MKNIAKQSTKVLILYYIGRLISFLTKAYFLPWALGAANLGLYSGLYAIGFVVARLDISNGVIRFFAKLQSDEQKPTFFLIILIVSTVIYWVVATPLLLWKAPILYFFKDNAPEIIDYFPIGMLLGYVILLNITVKSWFVALKQIIWPNFLQHITLPLLVDLNVLAYCVGFLSFGQMIKCILLPYCINLCLLTSYLFYTGELRLSLSMKRLEKSFIRSFILYSLFIILGTNLMFVLTRADTIMILSMCSKEETGIYSIIVVVALLLNVPVKAVNQATFSLLADMLANHYYDDLAHWYKKITLYQSFFIGFIFSAIYASLPYIFYALPAQMVYLAKQVFLLLAVGELVYNMFNTSHAVLTFSKYFKLNIITPLFLCLGIGLNYILISKWGLLGAGFATFVILLFAGISNCLLVFYTLKMHPFSLKLFVILLATCLNIILQSFLPTTSYTFLDTAFRLLIAIATYIVLAFCYKDYFVSSPQKN
ncbi:MAG: hypothetical protein AAF380_00855 [Bacteroidota bacterium]